MRKALVVGLDYYESLTPLFGCVNDAHAVKSVLERHADGTVNFDVRLLTATGTSSAISRRELKEGVKQLFAGSDEIALFYFAGHAQADSIGGYLCSSDSDADDGFSISDLVKMAVDSQARNKVIVLDACHSGLAGQQAHGPLAELSDGMTILTASTAEQYASEQTGSGVFTTLFVDALNGAASNLVGDITPGAVYAHIDQSLGPWEQRPVFKTNVKSFVSLRRVSPPIPLADLLRITEFFPVPGFVFKLDPSFEPEIAGREPGMPPPDPLNTARFAILQKYNRINLVVPDAAPHMWHAAMHSKGCRLTVLGEHYRRLVQNRRL